MRKLCMFASSLLFFTSKPAVKFFKGFNVIIFHVLFYGVKMWGLLTVQQVFFILIFLFNFSKPILK